ncbi:MAG: ABC transporter permease [Chloroflexota bacterium]
MARLILNRVVLGAGALVLVAVAVFLLTDVLPGDLCTAMLGREARGARLERCRVEYDTNRPPAERFAAWASGALRLDFGRTYRRDVPVAELVAPRLRNTAVLAGAAALAGVPLAIALGVAAAVRRDGPLDLVVSGLALVAMTLPEFVSATLLVFLFSIVLGWFPAVSVADVDAPLAELLPAIVLPVIVLAFVMIAHILRLVRGSMIEALRSDYVRAATLRGVSTPRVVLRHALPNALLPTINLVALTLAWLLGGTLVVEAVFNYPGIGTLLLNAISDRDLPVVQALALLLAALYLVINLAADLAALALDPRLRTTGR